MKDLKRTFTFDNEFTNDKEQNDKLMNVLMAISNSYPQVGYCQGMNQWAGFLLINDFDEEYTYWIIISLFEKHRYIQYFREVTNIQLQCYVLQKLLIKHLPKVYQVIVNTQSYLRKYWNQV